MEELPIIPGRGFNTRTAIEMRADYLKTLGINLQEISHYTLDIKSIQNNIESFIGCVEIPVGIVGPLLVHLDNNDKYNSPEMVFAAVGTLEGALVYSMNRGAKVLSKAGGVRTYFHAQCMLRSPMYIMDSAESAQLLLNWVNHNFEVIKKHAEEYTNHGELLRIDSVVDLQYLHLRFYFKTGDASGQNMTTTCTWHAALYIQQEFERLYKNKILDFVVEGNGASDKKISQYNIQHGRGCKVSAECEISNAVIQDVLRTTADDILKFLHPSQRLAQKDGMVGYNINVANAIAAIFVATGQDLASIHESGTGFLEVHRTEAGLRLHLTLPNLVIGTVGGGTHLVKQAEALDLMGCNGGGKLTRLAQLIAGFALGLEISTYSAIVSGEFAKAHEKLGRNKPVNWLLKSEIDVPFISACLKSAKAPKIESIEWVELPGMDHGILSQLSGKVSKKLNGYYPIRVNNLANGLVLLKAKPLSDEIIKGLQLVAASINTRIAELLPIHKSSLEYNHCHTKEIAINRFLLQSKYPHAPEHFGDWQDEYREIFLLLQEYIHPNSVLLLNSENHPHLWSEDIIKNTLLAIHQFHLLSKKATGEGLEIPVQKPWLNKNLYSEIINTLVIHLRNNQQLQPGKFDLSKEEIDWIQNLNITDLEAEFNAIDVKPTLIHNDFNPRNIMILKDGTACIYDWELCMRDLPHRDIMELLSFVLTPKTTEAELLIYLNFYRDCTPYYHWKDTLLAFRYTLKCLIVSRFSFYEVSGIVSKYDFSSRVLKTALHLFNLLQKID